MKVLCVSLILCVFFLINATADEMIDERIENFTVVTIYFKPAGSEPFEEKLASKMANVQQFYEDEMNRHGFGHKTFKLETDDNGDVKIRVINAKHPARHYETDTKNRVFEELPDHFKTPDCVLIIFVGAIEMIRGGILGATGQGFSYGSGGWVIIVANHIIESDRFVEFALKHHIVPVPDMMAGVMAHELGHAFGLYHNIVTPQSIMAMDLGPPHLHNLGTDLFFSELECRWLDKSYYFNDDNLIHASPDFTGKPYYRIENVDGIDFVAFNMSIRSQYQIHQVQLVNLREWVHLEWLTFKEDCDNESPFIENAKFLVERDLLGDSARLWVSMLDIKGNYRSAIIDFNEADLQQNIAAAPSMSNRILTTRWAKLKR